jgi:hypothetical protein
MNMAFLLKRVSAPVVLSYLMYGVEYNFKILVPPSANRHPDICCSTAQRHNDRVAIFM